MSFGTAFASRKFWVALGTALQGTLAASTGDIQWSYPPATASEVPRRPSLLPNVLPLAMDDSGRAFVVLNANQVYCLRAGSGEVLWTATVGPVDGRGIPRLAILDSNHLLVSGVGGWSALTCLDSGSGNLRWSAPDCWYPVVGTDQRILAVREGKLMRLDPLTGATSFRANWSGAKSGLTVAVQQYDGWSTFFNPDIYNRSAVAGIASAFGGPGWRIEPTLVSRVIPVRGNGLIMDDEGGVVRFNSASTGINRWRVVDVSAGAGRRGVAPIRSDGSDRFWMFDDGEVRERRLSDGRLTSRYSWLPSPWPGFEQAESATILADGTFLQCVGSVIYGVDPVGRRILWKRELSFRGLPVLGWACNVASDGAIVVAGFLKREPGVVPQEIVLFGLEGSALLAPGWSRIEGSAGQNGSQHPGAPRFVRPVRHVIARAGAKARIETWISGYPSPEFRWTRNGIPLDGHNEPQLEFARVTPADEGIYQVNAENTFGTSDSGEIQLSLSHTNIATIPWLRFEGAVPPTGAGAVECASTLNGPWTKAGPLQSHSGGLVDLNLQATATRYYRSAPDSSYRLQNAELAEALVMDVPPGTVVEVQRGAHDSETGDYWVHFDQVTTTTRPYLWIPPVESNQAPALFRLRRVE